MVYSETSLFQPPEFQPPLYCSHLLMSQLKPLCRNFTLKFSHLIIAATFVGPKGGWNSESPLYHHLGQKWIVLLYYRTFYDSSEEFGAVAVLTLVVMVHKVENHISGIEWQIKMKIILYLRRCCIEVIKLYYQ